MNFAKKILTIVTKPRSVLILLYKKCAKLIKNDKLYLKGLWRLKMGYPLNLDNPQTFNEKLQWLKLYDRKPIYTKMVDKYEAKYYVASIIGEKYIIPTLAVYDRVEDINFDTLPYQFVLKCTHDSGGLVICRNKEKLDIEAAKKELQKFLKSNYFYQNREWPYKNVKPRIIAEQYMEDSDLHEDTNQHDVKGLVDYKFYCFNGEAKYLYVSKGLENHATARISFLNMDWQFAPFGRSDFAPFDELPEKPSRFDEMVKIANRISKGHSFLRVDLYQINGQIYFSELTFHPCSGMMPFKPEKWDKIFGEWIALPA